jgi:hypothetical protein
MAYSSRPTSMLPGAGLRQPSQPSSALSTRIAAKKAELENLRQLRDLSGTLAMQMQALESKIATLKDGTEGGFLPLSTTARLLICFQPLHACWQIGITFSVPSVLPPVSLRGCLSEGEVKSLTLSQKKLADCRIQLGPRWRHLRASLAYQPLWFASLLNRARRLANEAEAEAEAVHFSISVPLGVTGGLLILPTIGPTLCDKPPPSATSSNCPSP